MNSKTPYLAALAPALALILAAPAYAESTGDRAQEAIAKLQTAQTAGAATDVPQEYAQAQQALADAREDVAEGKKEDAIMAANHSAALADAVVLEAQKHRDMAAARQNDMAQQQVNAAQQSAAAAQQTASSAQQDAAAARQQAADASQRADAAQLTAAQIAAQAAAAPPPAQVATTVTTTDHTTGTARHHHTVVHQTTAPVAATDTTKTTVTQTVQQ
jgi:hypothetical protein